MHSQQRFIGSHHMLARSNGFEHQRLGNAIAANELNHNINVFVGDHGTGVIDDRHVGPHRCTRALGVQISHHGDFDTPSGAPFNFDLVALQNVERSRAHYA